MVAAANSFDPPIEFDALAIATYVSNTADVTTPTTAASVPTPSGSGGSLPSGTYNIYYTWVDGISGIETSVGTSKATFTNTSGAVPVVTIPSLPAWGAASRQHLSDGRRRRRRNRNALRDRRDRNDIQFVQRRKLDQRNNNAGISGLAAYLQPDAVVYVRLGGAGHALADVNHVRSSQPVVPCRSD